MKYSNNYFRALTLAMVAALGLFPTAIRAIALPNAIQNGLISARQKAKFGYVITSALYKHIRGTTNEHLITENRFAQIYTTADNCPHYNARCLLQGLQRNGLDNTQRFNLGASSSAYQIEGGLDATSASARFYQKIGLPTAGNAIDFYHRYPSLIKQMKEELGINTLRISLAWDRIEPTQGVFNEEAIAYYKDVINTLLANGIKPMVVFHHYDVPTWFEDLRGFELQENGKLFQRFCLTVYTALAEELGECLISMCNAPEGPAFKGYYTGDGTPGEKGNIQKTHTVIANMYYELVDTALAIQKRFITLHKNNSALKCPSIGTQINVIFLDPYHTKQSDLKTAISCAMASYIQSGGTFDFLVNGHYCMYTPDAGFMKQVRGINVYRYHPHASKAFDWIGVNIYSNRFLDGSEQITGDKLIEQDEERYTDNKNYRNYPEGIYRAVKLITENVAIPLGKIKNKDGKPLPIIITENGIATKDDAKRTRYFQRAMLTITQLINDGYPVIGYLPWTSHDNYEWPTQDNPEGFGSKCYGFFAVNFDKNSPDYLQATLKKGSEYYAQFAKSFFATA